MSFTDRPTDPEYRSIESFVAYLIDVEGEDTFNHLHLGVLEKSLGRSRKEISKELKSWGLKLARREKEPSFRGFNTSSHDRWYGPGSSKTHGGSGWSQITGIAGQEG